MNNKYAVNEHSSVRVEGEKIFYFDPFKIEDAPHDADIIFLTHNHFDHFSPEDDSKVYSGQSLFIVPTGMRNDLLKAGVPDSQICGMLPGTELTVFGLNIEAVPAYNMSKDFHPKKNGWLGFVVTMNDERVYVAGDTDATPEAFGVQCDVAFIPVGGTYTMDTKEAAALVNKIRPKVAVPTHYGSVVGNPTDGESFKSLVDPSIRVELLI